MIPLRWDDRPVGLRDPALVCAFTGWTDAGDSASSAVGVISRRLGAQRCATVDPELLYTMQSYRPHITVRDGVASDVDWPTVELRAAVVPTARRDLILVTGPSGSGKTTTLYSALNSLNRNSRNIATIEDPVEITLPGINQVAVFPRINLSFARILRSLIRQDPDVLMIGEIRDRETAEIAIQAAQTGHLVLSTLHSATGLEAINRLAHMGIPRYELVSSLRLVVAQRLLRTPATGRLGVFEFLPVTAAVKKYVLTEPYLSYAGLLQHEKIATLRDAALHHVAQNRVDLAEVDRVIPEE